MLVSLLLSLQCAAPCAMADTDQTPSAGKHLVENQKADAESPGSPGVLQAVAPAVQQGHAHSLQGVASPGVHAEGARRAIHPQSGGRETDPILSPSTLVATHGARRSDSFPATGSTLLFPQQDQTRSMPAAGAVINEDDEPTLEENAPDDPGTDQKRQAARMRRVAKDVSPEATATARGNRNRLQRPREDWRQHARPSRRGQLQKYWPARRASHPR